MSKITFLFIFPVIIFAGNINLSLKKHNGKAIYIVESPIQNLKSELDFPFVLYTLGLDYGHNLKYFNIIFNSSFLLKDKKVQGKDYDWHNKNLTVFSKSDNKIEKYYDIGIMISKDWFNCIDIFAKFNYKILDINWLNVYQEDYIGHKSEYVSGKILKYQQNFYKYNLGLIYKNTIFDKILIKLKPSLIYAFIDTKDTHILRNFYTIQNIKTFGYELDFDLTYKIAFNSNIILSLKHVDIEEKNIDMDYYNKFNEKYLSYPSSYSYKNTIIGIGYNYNF